MKTNIKSGEKEWSSKKSITFGLFTESTRPKPINDLYERSEKAPNFELVQRFRQDDKVCLKLYSDPGMFFQIWKDQLIEAAKKEQKEKKRPKNRKKTIRRDIAQPTAIQTNRVNPGVVTSGTAVEGQTHGWFLNHARSKLGSGYAAAALQVALFWAYVKNNGFDFRQRCQM